MQIKNYDLPYSSDNSESSNELEDNFVRLSHLNLIYKTFYLFE